MATKFPEDVDDNVNLPPKFDGDSITIEETNTQTSALKAIEAKLGVDDSDDPESHDAKLREHAHTGLDGSTELEVDVSGAIIDHEVAADPHPTYETSAEAQAKVNTHTGTATGAHAASAISFTPASTLASTNVQDAIEETLAEAGGGGGGAPTDATYLTKTANAGLSAEEVVGATPGGELGGTWASPTVDDTHAGSSHSGIQTAAEDTAAAALVSHTSDNTDIHGITDTSVLETTTGSAAKVATHEADTTAVHGITNTASLETTTGSQAKVDTHTADTTAAHVAASVGFTPVPGVTSTNVQNAIAEIVGVTPPGPTNQAPTVDAGVGQTVGFPTTVTLSATATDDGLPSPPAALTYQWTQTAGPGTATFTAPTAKTTNVSFSQAGVYTLQFAASDSLLTSTDTVQVTQTSPANQAPVVNAGSDQTASFPTTVTLSGSVSDDGLPNPPGATTKQWTKVSGPGTVTFSSPTTVGTTATFSLAGVYVLRLSASDSLLTGFDDIQITQTAPTNQAPTVNAGMDQTVAFGAQATLTAVVTDDGLPNPPGTTTINWTRVSGPGTVTFGTATSTTTTASFATPGIYVLRATVSDSSLTATDDVQVVMQAAPTGFNNVITGNVAGFTVPAGQNWKINGLVTSTANVVVEGTLTMRAGDTLRFTGINENNFVGGAMNGPNGETNHEPVASDIGLWFHDQGKPDIQGTTKLTWTRLTTSLAVGQTVFTLPEDPIGWQVGDELMFTPTFGATFDRYDERTITGISGRNITINTGLTNAHPVVPVTGTAGMGCEVANLTRDVIIEGTPTGRSHVMIASHTMPINFDYARIRHVGPRGASILGRYGLHFHHTADNTQGFVTEGVVVTNAGFHAFVTHASHGITHRHNIAHRTGGSQFWWDPDLSVSQGIPLSSGNNSNNITYDHCMASWKNNVGTAEDDGRASGFHINQGLSPVIKDCVAVGAQGFGTDPAGFVWPEKGGTTEWDFQGTNVCHNNWQHGMFVWENADSHRTPKNIIVYHNLGLGLLHGAYLNNYTWTNITFYENFEGSLQLHASPELSTLHVDFVNCKFISTDIGDCVRTGEHQIQTVHPTRFINCTFQPGSSGGTGVKKVFFEQGSNKSQEAIDFINSTWILQGRPAFLMGTQHPVGTVWRVQDSTHGTIELRPNQTSGATFNSTWQAWVKNIANFA